MAILRRCDRRLEKAGGFPSHYLAVCRRNMLDVQIKRCSFRAHSTLSTRPHNWGKEMVASPPVCQGTARAGQSGGGDARPAAGGDGGGERGGAPGAGGVAAGD